jgi:hypothetical protein
LEEDKELQGIDLQYASNIGVVAYHKTSRRILFLNVPQKILFSRAIA